MRPVLKKVILKYDFLNKNSKMSGSMKVALELSIWAKILHSCPIELKYCIVYFFNNWNTIEGVGAA